MMDQPMIAGITLLERKWDTRSSSGGKDAGYKLSVTNS